MLLAAISGWSITHLLVLAIVVAGVIAIAWIAFRAMGFTPPSWAVQMFWVVVIVVVAILAIHLILSVW